MSQVLQRRCMSQCSSALQVEASASPQRKHFYLQRVPQALQKEPAVSHQQTVLPECGEGWLSEGLEVLLLLASQPSRGENQREKILQLALQELIQSKLTCAKQFRPCNSTPFLFHSSCTHIVRKKIHTVEGWKHSQQSLQLQLQLYVYHFLLLYSLYHSTP